MPSLKQIFGGKPKKKKQKLPSVSEDALIKHYSYAVNGTFDYDLYREAQGKKAAKDAHDTWADERTLDEIADYARTRLGSISWVLCHGSKHGWESRYLAKVLDTEGLGTDLAPPDHAEGVATWDFHEVNPEWQGKASVIYTNSLDHAYDPKKAMDAWVDQLAPGGMIFVEHTMLDTPEAVTAADPFGAHPLVLPYLVVTWGKGRYAVTDIIRPSHKKPHWKPVEGERPDTDLDIWVFVIARVDG